MRPEERDAAYLLDMFKAAEKVHRYIHEKKIEDFLSDELLRDGIERNIEIVGEAARRVSEPFKQEHPDIPWRKIVAQRNVLIHEYESIGNEEIWDVATFHIPLLINNLKMLIPPLPPDEE